VRHFETRAVHAGERRSGGKFHDGANNPISTPIYASTTFWHPDVQTTDRVLGGEEAGYSYTRYGNPTVAAFEEAVAALESPAGGSRAFAFASGMAAMHAALLAAEIFGSAGAEVRFADFYDLEALERKVEELSPRALVVESVSNPLLRVADVPRLVGISRSSGATLIVDNTFGTPYLQRPLDLGADIVVHSATKYLSGHGDLTAGVVAAGPPYDGALDQVRKLTGGILGPFEAWLALRGLKTLPLRVERQCENARAVASFLAGHPRVLKVNHPSMKDHPDHEVASRTLAATGGLLSFELDTGGREGVFRFLNALELCVRTPSLGDIYTLATHPATSSHRDLSPARRERLGVKENLVRVSVGIEHPEDVISDLEQALERV
jgi:cystathionine gamma-synthase/methionine-gamma-lyase